MKKMIQIVKDNYKNFYFSLCVSLFLFVLFNLFFYCRYHTVDDTFMEMIACGAYGKPDYHMIYINTVIGFIISGLYSIIHVVPWHGLMHIVLSIFSLSTIMYVFFNRDNKPAKVLVALIVFIVSYEAYTKVQFTKTAAYLATAGYTLIAYSFECDNRLKKQIIGTFFLVSSFMMRTGMFLGCSAVCLGCLLPVLFKSIKNLKNNKRDFINLFSVGLCSLIMVGIVYLVDSACYSSERWQYYKTFNGYTTQFQDINFPSYYLYEKEFNALGIDLEDYLLYDSTDLNDPEMFSIEKMQKVKELQPYKEISLDEFVMFALRGYNTIFRQKTLAPFAFMGVTMLLLFVFGCKFKIVNWISVFYTGCAALFGFMYIYFMHGWYDRTTISIMFSILVTLLFLSDIKTNTINKIYISGIFLAMIAILFFSWNSYFKWNMTEWKNGWRINHEALSEIYEDKDHLYLCRTSFPMWKVYYTPYDEIKIGAMGNLSPLGDWICNTPLSIDVLAEYDVINPYKDMINNSKVYFIGDQDGLGPVMVYLKKHYNKDAEAIHVKNIGPYEVYSVVSSSNQ